MNKLHSILAASLLVSSAFAAERTNPNTPTTEAATEATTAAPVTAEIVVPPVADSAQEAAPTTTATANAAPSLETQLHELESPMNQAPAGVTKEKLYVVQSRYNPLKGRFGMSLGVARNFTGSSYLNMTQINGDVRFHLTDRWSLNLGGAYGFNSFTADADKLMTTSGIVPDAAYVKSREHLMAAFNVFYGKFRLSMDQVFYFDQYVAAGPGLIQTQFGSAPSGNLDVGFVFWAGKRGEVRIGLENEFFNEKRLKSESFERHSLAHLDIGYTFGESSEATERQ
jgi:outer membrane beta-barrel protein